MSGRHRRAAALVGAVAVASVGLVLGVAADALAAAGNDVGRNVGGLLKGYATQLYGGIVAIVSVVFLVNRHYKELALFMFAAIVVAWLVFSPDEIAHAARGIGQQVFG